jgi:hypothetical protein
MQCSAAERCAAGSCAPAPLGCGPSTCSGCCDDGGTCRGGRSTLACGIDGLGCAACPAGKLCSAGACITVTQCDVDCGTGCCGGDVCGATPCGNDGGACSTCGAGQLCSAGACIATTGTRWKLRVVSAQVAALKPSGEPWDDKSDPDPKVCVTVGDAGQVCTLEMTDTFSPAWNTLFPNVYGDLQLGHVELSVIDVDYPGETVLEEFGVLNVTPRWSGSQRWQLDGASVSRLRVDLEPAP